MRKSEWVNALAYTAGGCLSSWLTWPAFSHKPWPWLLAVPFIFGTALLWTLVLREVNKYVKH